MSEAVADKPEHADPIDVEGTASFTLMVGMWSAFSTLLIASPQTLDDVWRWLTELPLALEVPMWIAVLPWALALAAWQSSWDEWLRLLVVAVLGAVWTLISKPRPRRPSRC